MANTFSDTMHLMLCTLLFMGVFPGATASENAKSIASPTTKSLLSSASKFQKKSHLTTNLHSAISKKAIMSTMISSMGKAPEKSVKNLSSMTVLNHSGNVTKANGSSLKGTVMHLSVQTVPSVTHLRTKAMNYSIVPTRYSTHRDMMSSGSHRSLIPTHNSTINSLAHKSHSSQSSQIQGKTEIKSAIHEISPTASTTFLESHFSSDIILSSSHSANGLAQATTESLHQLTLFLFVLTIVSGVLAFGCLVVVVAIAHHLCPCRGDNEEDGEKKLSDRIGVSHARRGVSKLGDAIKQLPSKLPGKLPGKLPFQNKQPKMGDAAEEYVPSLSP